MKTARIGYIRVSSADQNLARQEETLKPYDLDRVFSDKASGKNLERPEFQRMIEFVREGDELYVCSMDRMARNLNDLLTITTRLQEKGVSVHFLKEKIDLDPAGETSAMTKLLMSMMGAVAEFERSLIRERQREGIAVAKANGVYKGRSRSVTDEQIEEIKEMVETGVPMAKAARKVGISRATAYRYLKRNSNE